MPGVPHFPFLSLTPPCTRGAPPCTCNEMRLFSAVHRPRVDFISRPGRRTWEGRRNFFLPHISAAAGRRSRSTHLQASLSFSAEGISSHIPELGQLPWSLMTGHSAHPVQLQTSQSPPDGMRTLGTTEGERPGCNRGSGCWQFLCRSNP